MKTAQVNFLWANPLWANPKKALLSKQGAGRLIGLIGAAGCGLLLTCCNCEVEAPRAFSTLTVPLRGGEAPSRAACESYLAERIDGAFNRNDLKGLYATLTPLHRHLYQRLVDRLAHAMQFDSLTMKSRLVDYRSEGDSAILLVDSTFHSKASRTLDIHREWSYVVLHDHSDVHASATAEPAGTAAQPSIKGEDLRTLIHVTVNPAHLPYADNKRAPHASWNEFSCGHCNYSLSAPKGWLMVPHRSAIVGCVEAVSFHSLTDDVSVDVAVHVGEPDANAEELLSRLLLHRLKGKQSPEINAWVPAAYNLLAASQAGDANSSITKTAKHSAQEKPRTQEKQIAKLLAEGVLRGAVATLVSEGEGEGDIEHVHLVCHGPMQYLIVSHAPAAGSSDEALSRASNEVIDSFMIQNLQLSPDDLLERVRRHSRCRMEGSNLTFEHPEIGALSFRLPGSWTGSLKTNHFLIDMACDCPNDSNHIKLQGAEPPVGHAAWSPAAADELLSRTLESFDAEVVSDSGWQQPEVVAEQKTWKYTCSLQLKKPVGKGKFAEVDLYLMMTDRILIALQTTTEDDRARPLIRGAVDSLSFVGR